MKTVRYHVPWATYINIKSASKRNETALENSGYLGDYEAKFISTLKRLEQNTIWMQPFWRYLQA
jgi:hypothetical protein